MLAALVGLTLLVALADLAGAPLGPLRAAGAAVLGPVERVVAPDVDERAAERVRLADRVRRLEDEAATREQDAALQEALPDVLGTGPGSRELRPARVVGLGRGGASGPRRVTLGVGSRDGVARDDAVVAADGLVGRVVSVATATSDVEVLGSAAAPVAVRVGGRDDGGSDTADGGVRGGGLLGTLTGTDPTTSRDADELVVTALARDRVSVGDAVVTLGSPGGRPYPAGVVVGEVTSVEDRAGRLTDTAIVRPAVDLAALDVVGVVVARDGS